MTDLPKTENELNDQIGAAYEAGYAAFRDSEELGLIIRRSLTKGRVAGLVEARETIRRLDLIRGMRAVAKRAIILKKQMKEVPNDVTSGS